MAKSKMVVDHPNTYLRVAGKLQKVPRGQAVNVELSEKAKPGRKLVAAVDRKPVDTGGEGKAKTDPPSK